MWPLHFQVTDAEVQVRLGSLVLRRVLLDDIESVGVLGGCMLCSREYWSWNEHWTNLWPLRYVVLRRRTGWPRRFLINPPDTDRFVTELRRQAPHLS